MNDTDPIGPIIIAAAITVFGGFLFVEEGLIGVLGAGTVAIGLMALGFLCPFDSFLLFRRKTTPFQYELTVNKIFTADSPSGPPRFEAVIEFKTIGGRTLGMQRFDLPIELDKGEVELCAKK